MLVAKLPAFLLIAPPLAATPPTPAPRPAASAAGAALPLDKSTAESALARLAPMLENKTMEDLVRMAPGRQSRLSAAIIRTCLDSGVTDQHRIRGTSSAQVQASLTTLAEISLVAGLSFPPPSVPSVTVPVATSDRRCGHRTGQPTQERAPGSHPSARSCSEPTP